MTPRFDVVQHFLHPLPRSGRDDALPTPYDPTFELSLKLYERFSRRYRKALLELENRVAALGEKIILLANLAWSAVL